MSCKDLSFLFLTMTIIDLTKKGLKFITMLGNGLTVGALCGMYIFGPGVAIPLKICASVSSYILTNMVTDKTDAYIDEKIDQVVNEIKNSKEA